MLDAFRNMTGGAKGKLATQQATELELLIATAREERSAISAMLTAITAQSGKLAPLTKSLEQVAQKASSTDSRLEEISTRLASLDGRAKELEELDRRIQSLKDAAQQAEQTTQRSIGPDGELQKHREAVQQLSSQALQTQATVETLRKERAALEELRAQLRAAQTEVAQSNNQAGSLKTELEHVRSTATTLAQDYAKIRETSREAREDTSAAMMQMKEIETKLGPLVQLHELSRTTEERLTGLNALAEHVARKAKAMESQQQAVEHAVVQANRVNEMVWAMDVQIAKLTDGLRQATKAEETIGRVEKLAEGTGAQLEAASKTREDAERDRIRLTKEATALLESVRGHV